VTERHLISPAGKSAFFGNCNGTLALASMVVPLRGGAGKQAIRSAEKDASARTIAKKGGPRIDFEAGPSEGSWANPTDREKYSWYRERTINGYKVRFALIKAGVMTVWEPRESGRRQRLQPGNILLVTFLIGENSDFTANFKCKIANQQELADVILMVTTYNPRKDRL
jgi:hypothetical protein